MQSDKTVFNCCALRCIWKLLLQSRSTRAGLKAVENHSKCLMLTIRSWLRVVTARHEQKQNACIHLKVFATLDHWVKYLLMGL